MTRTTLYASFRFEREHEVLEKVVGIQVGDTIFAATARFEKKEEVASVEFTNKGDPIKGNNITQYNVMQLQGEEELS